MYPCTEEIIQLAEGHLLKCGSGLPGEKEQCKRRGKAGGSAHVRETRLLSRLWHGCARMILFPINRWPVYQNMHSVYILPSYGIVL